MNSGRSSCLISIGSPREATRCTSRLRPSRPPSESCCSRVVSVAVTAGSPPWIVRGSITSGIVPATCGWAAARTRARCCTASVEISPCPTASTSSRQVPSLSCSVAERSIATEPRPVIAVPASQRSMATGVVKDCRARCSTNAGRSRITALGWERCSRSSTTRLSSVTTLATVSKAVRSSCSLSLSRASAGSPRWRSIVASASRAAASVAGVRRPRATRLATVWRSRSRSCWAWPGSTCRSVPHQGARAVASAELVLGDTWKRSSPSLPNCNSAASTPPTACVASVSSNAFSDARASSRAAATASCVAGVNCCSILATSDSRAACAWRTGSLPFAGCQACPPQAITAAAISRVARHGHAAGGRRRIG